MKKFLIFVSLFIIDALNAGQVKPKAIPASATASKISPEVEQAVQDYEQATQALGDLLIKKGLLSPWLEKYRDAQQKLDAIDKKENLGIRQSSLEDIQRTVENCKERLQNKESDNPQHREFNALTKQKEELIKNIIQKKSTDIHELIAINNKMDKIIGKELIAAFIPTKAPKLPLVYQQVKAQIDAYDDIIDTAASSGFFKLNDDITQFFDSSPEAQQYITILKKMGNIDHRKQCTPDVSFKLHNKYANAINGIAFAYSYMQDQKNKKK